MTWGVVLGASEDQLAEWGQAGGDPGEAVLNPTCSTRTTLH